MSDTFRAADVKTLLATCGLEERKVRPLVSDFAKSEHPLVLAGVSTVHSNSYDAVMASHYVNVMLGNYYGRGQPFDHFELWGGNRRVAEPVELPGLIGWIQSTPLEPATEGGDVHYVSVCAGGTISRIALADVAGHGDSVSAVAERLCDALQRHTGNWDQSALMRELNDAFLAGATGLQYATAVVLGFYRQTGELLFSNAGHLPPFWYRAAEQKWDVLEADTPHARVIEGLPLGVIPGTDYTQTAVKLGLNDLVVLYTDGCTEARDEAGESPWKAMACEPVATGMLTEVNEA